MLHAKTVFIHSHIRKCGGTTFKSILKQNFNEAIFHSSNIGLQSELYSCEDMKEAVKRNDFVRIFSRHEISLDLPYEDFDSELKQIKGIAFVRNPVDRVFSWYFYRRNKDTSRFYEHEISERYKSLDEHILDLTRSENIEGITQSQIYHLSGGKDKLKDFLYAINSLVKTGKIFLFPLDRFNESILVLEHIFPRDFKDYSYTLKNISIKDLKVSEEQKSRIASILGNCLDQQLYSLANIQLSNLIASCFPDHQSLQLKLASLERRNKKKTFILSQVRPFYAKCLIKLGLQELL
jgi:hypothetical protein